MCINSSRDYLGAEWLSNLTVNMLIMVKVLKKPVIVVANLKEVKSLHAVKKIEREIEHPKECLIDLVEPQSKELNEK